MANSMPLRVTSVVNRIGEVGTQRVPFSVEFFPPRDEAAEARLWRAGGRSSGSAGVRVDDLRCGRFDAGPHGARHRQTGRAKPRLLPVAHMTAVGAQRRRTAGAGRRIRRPRHHQHPGCCVATRPATAAASGRSIRTASSTPRTSSGWSATSATSTSVSRRSPRGTPRAGSRRTTPRYLVSKLRAGAEYSITQMFFDVDDYLRLRDRVPGVRPRSRGPQPIIPEIDADHVAAVGAACYGAVGVALPAPLLRSVWPRPRGPVPEENRAARCARSASSVATEMSERLHRRGCARACTSARSTSRGPPARC